MARKQLLQISSGNPHWFVFQTCNFGPIATCLKRWPLVLGELARISHHFGRVHIQGGAQ